MTTASTICIPTVTATIRVHAARIEELRVYAACGTPTRVAYAEPRIAHHTAAAERLCEVLATA